jgi:hypothetical protein
MSLPVAQSSEEPNINWAALVRTGSHGGHSVGEDIVALLQLPDTAAGRNDALRCARWSRRTRRVAHTTHTRLCAHLRCRFLQRHRAEWLAARAAEEEQERQERIAEATAWKRGRSRSAANAPRSPGGGQPSSSPLKAAPSTPGVASQLSGSSLGVSWDKVLDLCVEADMGRQVTAAARHSFHVGAPMLKCLRAAAAIKGAQGKEAAPKTRLSSPI